MDVLRNGLSVQLGLMLKFLKDATTLLMARQEGRMSTRRRPVSEAKQNVFGSLKILRGIIGRLRKIFEKHEVT